MPVERCGQAIPAVPGLMRNLLGGMRKEGMNEAVKAEPTRV
jgi:hypothetical protein